MQDETIESLEKHLKAQFKFKEFINITQPGFKSIDQKEVLCDNMELIFYTKPIYIQYQNNKIQIEQLIKVSHVNIFIQTQIGRNGVFIFMYNKEMILLWIGRSKKKLFKLKGDLFAQTS